MRFVTAGESHGQALTTIVSEVPAGVSVTPEYITAQLQRRQKGYGRGGRMAIETDTARVLSGVRFGKTIGSPVCIQVDNRDWENWTDRMAIAGEKPAGIAETRPRPGHADLVGMLKTDSSDARDILERASARETAGRVAAGAVAKALLSELGVTVYSFVRRIGDVEFSGGVSLQGIEQAENSSVRCPDLAVTHSMEQAIDSARGAGESLGGEFVIIATGLVPGLGDYASGAERLTSQLGGALFSIPAIKGVGFGDGFELAKTPGSKAHDEIVSDGAGGYRRLTNHGGGLEGGMTNGEPLIMTAAMKPIPTLMKPLATIDTATGQATSASTERSDVCAVPAAGVVGEAEVAVVLADAYCKKFGCDSLADLIQAIAAYRLRITR